MKRHKVYEKNKQSVICMTNKCGRTMQRTNDLRTNWFWEWTPSVNWPLSITIHVGVSGAVASLLRQVTKLGVSLHQQNDIVVIDIFNEKRKSCNHRCPDSVYFHTLLFIYLSAVERLICHRKISLIGPTSFSFAQNKMHDFQNTILNSLWHCLPQMPQTL